MDPSNLTIPVETDMEIQDEEQFQSEILCIRDDLKQDNLSVEEAEEMLQELIEYHVSAKIKVGEQDWKDMEFDPEVNLSEDAAELEGYEDEEPMPGSVFKAQTRDQEIEEDLEDIDMEDDSE